MKNYVELWMQENNIEIEEEFKLNFIGLIFYINDQYALLDRNGTSYTFTMTQLLIGNYTITKIKPKTKLTKEQYTFIKSFKYCSKFVLSSNCVFLTIDRNIDEVLENCLIRFQLDMIDIDFTNLNSNIEYFIEECELIY